jgi:signal peptidase I
MSFKQKLKYLDPYFYMDLFIEFLHKKDINYKILDVVIYILYSLILAYLLLKILGLLLGTSDAMMIVVSGSMDPTLKIGDIVVLKAPNNIQTNEIIINKDINKTPLNWFAKINYDLKTIISNNKQITLLDTKSITIDENKYDLKQEGAIIVYYSEIQKRKIIHRAIFKLTANDGNYYLTKGDKK